MAGAFPGYSSMVMTQRSARIRLHTYFCNPRSPLRDLPLHSTLCRILPCPSPLHSRSLDIWSAPLRFSLHRLTPRTGTEGVGVQGPVRVSTGARSRYSCTVNFLNLVTLCVDSRPKVLWRFAVVNKLFVSSLMNYNTKVGFNFLVCRLQPKRKKIAGVTTSSASPLTL